ncbi:hypothetical protein PUL39_030485 [Pseudomonas aeruginosa]|uniref:hypothetical protein n=1 Tax=Pseudomonas aeruginosa TaxID=287 RepID=UPI0023B07E5B|nr:hypothetical protein [Pseudomonas aeruginosa]MDE8660773.1 hypothetical protein [Pseudomonas aeruginosa]
MLTRLTDTLDERTQARFLVMDSSDWPEVMPDDNVPGLPVPSSGPRNLKDLSLSYQRLLDVLDNETGLPQFADLPAIGFPFTASAGRPSGLRGACGAAQPAVRPARGRQKLDLDT